MMVLGSGANILVSDAGLDKVVVHNQARKITVDLETTPSSLAAESGAILTSVARKAAELGLSGLEWASTVPGTVGGAVYGNAGAFGSNAQSSLLLVEILHRTKGYLTLTAAEMGYAYRSSVLKRDPGDAVILMARFAVSKGDPERIEATMKDFSERRRRSQPAGPSTGSTFKTPGRLRRTPDRSCRTERHPHWRSFDQRSARKLLYQRWHSHSAELLRSHSTGEKDDPREIRG